MLWGAAKRVNLPKIGRFFDAFRAVRTLGVGCGRMDSPDSRNDLELCNGDLRLRGTELFLDATRPRQLSFISHAHADHLARHEQAIATAATLALAGKRGAAPRSALPVPYRQPFNLGALELTLFPAGHVLGSAQLRVVRSVGRTKQRILYTGDLNPVPGLTAEPAEPVACDLLVLESTFGLPRYRFPPREETYEAMAAFARRCFDAGAVPTFLAYSLGKAQEGIKALVERGVSVAAHPAISELCEVYERFGCALPHRLFRAAQGREAEREGGPRQGEALFWPLGGGPLRLPESAMPLCTAALTGWALDSSTRYRMGVDEAFPLSDHGDFEALLGYAAATGAKRILTHHGSAKEFAAALRDRGFEAWPLVPSKQLELF